MVENEHDQLADSLLQSVQAQSGPNYTSSASSVAAPAGQVYPSAGPLSPRHGRMRSSIACIRCRRSKVKCVNNGVGTTCRSCENSGRDCSYPPPVTTGGGRRRDSLSGRPDVIGAEPERRQRPKKSTHTVVANPMNGSHESPRPLLDALDPRLLTATVWQELFDIFQIHYSADLPFLHPPTFLKPLRQTVSQPASSFMVPTDTVATVRPPASPGFLLAFLALTVGTDSIYSQDLLHV